MEQITAVEKVTDVNIETPLLRVRSTTTIYTYDDYGKTATDWCHVNT